MWRELDEKMNLPCDDGDFAEVSSHDGSDKIEQMYWSPQSALPAIEVQMWCVRRLYGFCEMFVRKKGLRV